MASNGRLKMYPLWIKGDYCNMFHGDKCYEKPTRARLRRYSNGMSPRENSLAPTSLIYPPLGVPTCPLPETAADSSALADAICSPPDWGLCQLQCLVCWHRPWSPEARELWLAPHQAGESCSLADWDWWDRGLMGRGNQCKLGGLPEGDGGQ